MRLVGHSSVDLSWEHGEHDEVRTHAIVLPIGLQLSLPPKAHSFSETKGGRVLLRHEHLKAAKVELPRAPIGEHTESFGGDPSTSSLGNDPTPKLAHLMLTHHDHDFAKVRIRRYVGNHEVEQFIVRPVLLKVVDNASRILCRQGRHPERRRRIPTKLHGVVEVLLPERTEDEGRTLQLWLWIGNHRGDRTVVAWPLA